MNIYWLFIVHDQIAIFYYNVYSTLIIVMNVSFLFSDISSNRTIR